MQLGSRTHLLFWSKLFGTHSHAKSKSALTWLRHPNSHLFTVHSCMSSSCWNNTGPWLLLGKTGAVLEGLLFSFPLYPPLERNDSALYLVWGGRICPWASSLPLQVSMYLYLRREQTWDKGGGGVKAGGTEIWGGSSGEFIPEAGHAQQEEGEHLLWHALLS